MLTPKEKSKPPKDSMTLLPCFYFVELPIVASSVVSLYFLELTDLFQPAKVGFQCHDRTLSMPYVQTSEELIPLLMLLSLAFAAPAASIMVGEGILYCLQSRLWGRGGGSGSEGSINAGGCNFNSFLRRTVRFVGVHVFGLCATALVTDIIQLATGYHAPFFLTVCKPNYTLLGTSCEANPYITQDICAGPDAHAILSARKTFPSQHATLSAFAAVYVSMYFNAVISDTTKLLKPILVFAFAIAAGVCGLTQVTQYRSHAVDVYVGFLIGAGIAAYLACHAVGHFQAPPPERPAAPAAADALRALTLRSHAAVYQQHKAVSTDELAPSGRLDAAPRPAARDKGTLGSLKRASVDADLLAPRSPLGKDMVTFSHTLPRVSAPTLDDPARRHMTVHVPRQLVSEWKQRVLDGRGDGGGVQAGPGREPMVEEDEDPEDEEEEDQDDDDAEAESGPAPPPLYPSVQARPPGARVLLPALGHIPEAVAPSLSPQSAAARAKWVLLDKGAGTAGPRLLQVIAMSRPPGRAGDALSSSSASSDSFRSPSERGDSASLVAAEALGPAHPVVHLSATGPGELELGRTFRGGGRSRGLSPGSSLSDAEQDGPPTVATVNLATGEGLPPPGMAEGARGAPGGRQEEAEAYFRRMQARRFDD